MPGDWGRSMCVYRGGKVDMAIDHNFIRENFASLGLFGSEDTGLLRRFGVILNADPVDFLVGRELDFINTLGSSSRSLSEKVLIDAAQWCANATFAGIMASPEWASLIEPHVKTPTDRLDGMVAITNCLGWGKMVDVKLDEAAQTLEYKVRDSYYVGYWIKKYGKSDCPICYMWTGVTGGFLDLLFGSKVHDFEGEEISCGAVTGEPFCTFRARKLRKKFGL